MYIDGRIWHGYLPIFAQLVRTLNYLSPVNKIMQKPELKLADGKEIEAGPLLKSMIAAKSRSRECVDPTNFRDTADAMTEAVLGLRGRSLYGVSDLGHAIAGAMAYRSNGLTLWDPQSGGSVVLIDGIIASGAGLSLAAERAREIGAKHVEALIVGFVGAAELPKTGIDRLVSLRPSQAPAAYSA